MSVVDTPPRLLTVRQFADAHPWATIGGLRHAIFHARATGLDRAIVRWGRRVLLDEAAVIAWMREHGRTLSGRGGAS